jgi:predicted dehydrogenase
LVGTGIGRLHALGMKAMSAKTSLTGVCARPLEDAQRLADEFDAPFATDDYDRLLERDDVEAIDLCVPHDLHMPMSIAAAQAGKHILVEKPIARDLAEADVMIAAARTAGVSLMVSHNQRYFGHHAKARELLDAGAIGDPFMIVASVHVHGHIEGFRRFLEKAGGGTLIDSGVHRFDLIRWLMGDVASLYAQKGRFMQMQMEGEDCAVVVMRFRSGAIGSFSCSWSAKGPVPEETLQIFGPRGAILTEDHTRSLRWHSESPPSGLEDVREFVFPIDQAESIRRAIAAFADSILQGAAPPITGEDGRAALELAMASYQAAASECPVHLPL